MGDQAALQFMYVLYQAQIRSFVILLWKIFPTCSSSLLLVGNHRTVQSHTRTYSCLQFGTHLSFTPHLHWVSTVLLTSPTLSRTGATMPVFGTRLISMNMIVSASSHTAGMAGFPSLLMGWCPCAHLFIHIFKCLTHIL